MKFFSLLIIATGLFHYSAAQLSAEITPDTVTVSPNIMRVHAEVLSTDKSTHTAVIRINKVVGFGSGVINMLSPDQEVTVRINDESIRLTAKQKIDADLREKMGADASITTYTLLQARKYKP
jgi:hypothetical protein